MQTMTSGQAACLAGSSRVVRRASVSARPQGGRPALVVVAGNDYETGVFSPLVVVVRNAMGVKEFNQFRGKAISLHSQVCGHADSLAGGGLRGWEYPGAQQP